MTIEMNDPRLTAYALGELSGDEKAAFEALLAASPEARREVEAIAELAKDLEGELATGVPIELGDAQRAAIEATTGRGAHGDLRGVAKEDVDEDTVEDGGTGGADETDEAGESEAPVAEHSARRRKATARTKRARGERKLEMIDGGAGDGEPVRATRTIPARSWALKFAPYAAAGAIAAGAVSIFVVNRQPMQKSADVSASAAATMGAEPSRFTNSRYGIQGTAAQQMLDQGEKRVLAPQAPDAALHAKIGGRRGDDIPLGRNAPSDGTVANPQPSAFPSSPNAPPENPFVDAKKEPTSTFSIDVDTASYSMIRRTLQSGSMPSADFVRIEEMVNYFPYTYPQPDDAAFSVTTDVAAAPWAPSHRLVRIGLHGREVTAKARPGSNLVFLIDVSGSMESPDKLPLLVHGLEMLSDGLDQRDHVAIVVYAGASGLVLPSTSGADHGVIRAALAELHAGGSTNGAAGIELAYAEAKKNFVPGGINRVILATDGDFNVGVTSQDALVALVQQKAKDGVFLTVLGFGLGNYRDSTLESLADKGNGNYAYVDDLAEAKKVLVEQAAGTLLTIAKDVKIQVTFDPASVASFKLLGYENRLLAKEDFADDKKDAGEIGAGHTVTALYEIVPRDGASAGNDAHLADVALRYKEPEQTTSRLVETKIHDGGQSFDAAPADFRFAASVAGFGLLLRGSKAAGDFGYADVERIAGAALGDDRGGHRKEFVDLVKRAEGLARQ